MPDQRSFDFQSLRQRLQRLRSLAASLDPALAAPIQQVSTELARAGKQLELQTAELQQQRQSWDAERQQAAADIQEQSRLLAEAWLRLESERRHPRITTSPNHPAAVNQPDDKVRSAGTQSQPRDSVTPSLTEQFRLLTRESRQAGAIGDAINGNR